MAIRPVDLRRKEFKNSLRGYDANEVDDFLDAVADAFERTYSENVRMREENSGLRERLEQFEELEGSIRSALVHAEQAANDLRNSSNREAEAILQEAKSRSHQILADSSNRVQRVQESYEALQEAKRSFANDFRHLLKTYMDMMEKMEVNSAKEIEASLRERLDTESIAVAREAAEHSAGEQQSMEPEDGGATQRIDADDLPEASPQLDPEVEEPEVEPSSVEDDGEQEAVATESEAAGEVEREEPPFAGESRSDEFWNQGDKEHESSPEDKEEGRIFRASRFLRRRE